MPLTNTPLQFEFPPSLTAEKFITQLSHQVDTCLIVREHTLKTYYDSFDWRLYSNGIICEVNSAKKNALFLLRELAGNAIIANIDIKKIPVFSKQFSQVKIRNILDPVLEMRALLAVCTLEYENFQVNIINKDEKTVLRLFVEEYPCLHCCRVFLQPVKGYDKCTEHIISLITGKLELTPVDTPILLAALAQQGRRPKDYAAKLNINLAPDMRADVASKYIYSHLLKIIKANEQGVIADTDSEFLHDFRVAIRKTRSGLSQLKGVLPSLVNARFSEFFSWLGQVTGPTRDLDVYLLNFEGYKNSLPISIRDDLNPLHDFLIAKQQKAQRDLAKMLNSEKYLGTLFAWEQFLKEESCQYSVETHAKLTIKQLADLRLWKIYRRVVQEGDAITDYSKPEALHELRKSCKKLRYLMEFFESLYPKKAIKRLLSHLKALQEVLGAFQDHQVQEAQLRQFSEEMLAANVPVNTFLAMGVLIQHLDKERENIREGFKAAFMVFREPENHKLFDTLFNNKTT